MAKRTIGERWLETKRRPSGFDYLRIVLAVSVLLWHSYLVSYGISPAIDLWAHIPGLVIQMILPMFFALSGFLVCGSLIRMQNISGFLRLRVIRLFPALVVEVCLSALVLGPIVTTLDLREYFTDNQFLFYFLNLVGRIHYNLPGVFLTNPLRANVNVSLWTVPYELECYIVLAVAWLLGCYRSPRRAVGLLVVASAVVCVLVTASGEHSANAGGIHGRVLVLCFLSGTVVFMAMERLAYDLRWAAIAFLTAMALFRYDATAYLAPLLIAYATVCIGLLDPPRSYIVSSGDYSYGIYLYACPIQQFLVYLLGAHNSWATNAMLALPLTFLLAVLSWRCVEKPFQNVKRMVIRGKTARGGADPVRLVGARTGQYSDALRTE